MIVFEKKVDEMILMDYSPKQIVGVCRRQGIKMVSHETIYQYIWWDKAHGGELYKHLRHRGRRHKKRGALRKRSGTIPNRIDISERPRKRHGFLSPNQVFSKSTGLDARLFV